MKKYYLYPIKIIVLGFFLTVCQFSCNKDETRLSDELKSVIKNPEYATDDGRLVIGFTPIRRFDGLKTGNWQAIYEGDTIPKEFYTN